MPLARNRGFLLLAAALSLGTGCPPDSSGGGAEPEGARETAPPEAAPADGRLTQRLGFELLRRQAAAGDPQVLISPHGVASALLLAWSGAEGETRRAIGEVVGLPPDADFPAVAAAWRALDGELAGADDQLRLSAASSAWLRREFELLPAYLERLGNLGAVVEALDFTRPEASRRINRWVAERTEGRIPDIVPARIPDETVLYLINALYFHGAWSEPFDPDLTRQEEFHRADGTVEPVPMMRRSGRFAYGESNGSQVVRLPYGDGRLAMHVVLPAAGGLDGWLEELDPAAWSELTGSLSRRQGQVVLPRLRFDYAARLRQALTALGMGVAFTERADFGALAGEPVQITDVIHKGFIEVNEEGTEAAAATAVEIGITSAIPEPPFRFVADRPFFFAVSDGETGTLLFVGIVRAVG